MVDGIVTHDGVLGFVGSLRDAWAPRFKVSRLAARETSGVIQVLGPDPSGVGERDVKFAYALPAEPLEITRRAFAAIVGAERLPDYMREARPGS